MTIFKELMKSPIDNSPLWDELSLLYDSFTSNNSQNNNIPKKIHQIWLGGELPTYYNRLIDSIKLHNPDWEYKLWTDKDLENYKLINQELFNKVNNYGVKADLLRYEILYNEGGLYLDIDFFCVKSFNNILKNLDFIASCGHVIEPEVFNGLFACKPNHILLKNIINKLTNIETTNELGDLYHNIGSKHFSREFFNYLSEGDKSLVVLPTVYFYSYPALDRFQTKYKEFDENNYNKITSYLTNESIVIHFWHSNWQ